MKRPGRVLRFAAPLKIFAQRFTFLGLVAASVGLMVMGKAETPLVEQARTALTDAFAPILDAASRPVATVADFSDRISGMLNVYSDNQRLREENDRLLNWQSVARKLEVENRNLRDMAHFVPEGQVSFVSARVVADAGGAF